MHIKKIDNDLKEDLVEKFNNAAISIDTFNCLFDNDCEDDMNDLSDTLSINRIGV